MEIYISTHCYNRFKKTQTLAIKFGRILVYNRLKLNQTTTALVIVPSINIDGVRKLQGDIESMQGSKSIRTPHACAECKRRKIRCDGRHWQCLGCRSPKQVIAQPQEDKCVHCFTDRRICDQAKPSCGNCVKRKLKCRPQENAVPSSLFFYSEVYSGFPKDALNA
jgi:hypothetical protein